ncbi:MAG: histidine phosphatase family protein, partial [Actinobacteria bacterium]|nr:histidine phosphatase family protein [Actinomycetota bacterium]
HRQAQAVGRWFAALPDGEKPEIVLSSPYVRARQTAREICEAGGIAGGRRPPLIDERLREREFGIFDRLTTAGVDDETNIQMHMCYSEFGDIIEAIDALDVDVALIEASRSNMELLDDFAGQGYARSVGPGVYDIHSPRVPSVQEMAEKLRIASTKLDRRWIWVNPDCGLKTRGWEETEPSLKNMVAAAVELRKEYSGTGG